MSVIVGSRGSNLESVDFASFVKITRNDPIGLCGLWFVFVGQQSAVNGLRNFPAIYCQQ